MSSVDIGDTIIATYRGQPITGVIVGREDASRRRGYGTGQLLTVRTEAGEWVQVHEKDIRQEQPAS